MRILFAVLLVVLLALQYAWWFGKGGVRDVRRLETQIAEQEHELEALRQRNSTLAAEVVDLKHGLDAVEEIARSEMGMVKQGEIFFQLVEPAPDLASHEAMPTAPPEQR
jgi:cell division protein FtsB